MQTFLGKKLFVLTAHPDDESYLAAGTLHANQLAGGQNFLICATAGEKGNSHLKKALSKSALKKIRHKELKRACGCIGKTHLIVLNLADEGLRNKKSLLLKKSLDLARQYQPDVIMSFGPDGITGHHDHLSVCEVAQKISTKLNLPLATFALPPIFARHAESWLKRRRKSLSYIDHIVYPKPNVKIKINSTIKKQALKCHASQLDNNDPFVGYPDYAIKAMLKYEYFVIRQK